MVLVEVWVVLVVPVEEVVGQAGSVDEHVVELDELVVEVVGAGAVVVVVGVSSTITGSGAKTELSEVEVVGAGAMIIVVVGSRIGTTVWVVGVEVSIGAITSGTIMLIVGVVSVIMGVVVLVTVVSVLVTKVGIAKLLAKPKIKGSVLLINSC